MVTTNQNKPKEFGYWEMHLKPDWSFFGFLIEFYLFYLLITPPAGSLTLLLNACSSDGTQNSSSVNSLIGCRVRIFLSLTHGFVYVVGSSIVRTSSMVSWFTRR